MSCKFPDDSIKCVLPKLKVLLQQDMAFKPNLHKVDLVRPNIIYTPQNYGKWLVTFIISLSILILWPSDEAEEGWRSALYRLISKLTSLRKPPQNLAVTVEQEVGGLNSTSCKHTSPTMHFPETSQLLFLRCWPTCHGGWGFIMMVSILSWPSCWIWSKSAASYFVSSYGVWSVGKLD